MVPLELVEIIKLESVIDFIANEFAKRMISRNNMTTYNIPDKIAPKSVGNLILKTANAQDSPCQRTRFHKKPWKNNSCAILLRFGSHLLDDQLKKCRRRI